jgi:hypothetical protein
MLNAKQTKMIITKNGFNFKVCNYYLDKQVILITPTPSKANDLADSEMLEDYPAFEEYTLDWTLEEIVEDITV